MSDLHTKLTDLIDRIPWIQYWDEEYKTADIVEDIESLLPSLKGWAKVEEQRGVDVGGATNIVTILTSPLKWEDVNWGEVLAMAEQCYETLHTKSGHKIKRERNESSCR